MCMPLKQRWTLGAPLNQELEEGLQSADFEAVRKRWTAPVYPAAEYYQDSSCETRADYIIEYLLKTHNSYDSDSSSSRSQSPVAAGHALETRWVLWFDAYQPGDEGSIESAVRQLGSFETIEEFWVYWNHLRVGMLKDDCNIRIFRSGIIPTWEDPMNANGGRWVVRDLPREQRDQLWTYAAMALIAEKLWEREIREAVCGVVLGTRATGDCIQLWTDGAAMKNASAEQAMHDSLWIAQRFNSVLFPDGPMKLSYIPQSPSNAAPFMGMHTQRPRGRAMARPSPAPLGLVGGELPEAAVDLLRLLGSDVYLPAAVSTSTPSNMTTVSPATIAAVIAQQSSLYSPVVVSSQDDKVWDPRAPGARFSGVWPVISSSPAFSPSPVSSPSHAAQVSSQQQPQHQPGGGVTPPAMTFTSGQLGGGSPQQYQPPMHALASLSQSQLTPPQQAHVQQPGVDSPDFASVVVSAAAQVFARQARQRQQLQRQQQQQMGGGPLTNQQQINQQNRRSRELQQPQQGGAPQGGSRPSPKSQNNAASQHQHQQHQHTHQNFRMADLHVHVHAQSQQQNRNNQNQAPPSLTGHQHYNPQSHPHQHAHAHHQHQHAHHALNSNHSMGVNQHQHNTTATDTRDGASGGAPSPSNPPRSAEADLAYRQDKMRQLEAFFAEVETHPDKFKKREVRNARRQYAMLQRREAQDRGVIIQGGPGDDDDDE